MNKYKAFNGRDNKSSTENSSMRTSNRKPLSDKTNSGVITTEVELDKANTSTEVSEQVENVAPKRNIPYVVEPRDLNMNTFLGINNKKDTEDACYTFLENIYLIISETTGGGNSSMLRDGKLSSDGLNILNDIRFEGPDEFSHNLLTNLSAATTKIAEEAGDGTSSFICMLALLYFSFKNSRNLKNISILQAKEGFEIVLTEVISKIENMSIDLNSITAEQRSKIIKDAILVASNNDEWISETFFGALEDITRADFEFDIVEHGLDDPDEEVKINKSKINGVYTRPSRRIESNFERITTRNLANREGVEMKVGGVEICSTEDSQISLTFLPIEKYSAYFEAHPLKDLNAEETRVIGNSHTSNTFRKSLRFLMVDSELKDNDVKMLESLNYIIIDGIEPDTFEYLRKLSGGQNNDFTEETANCFGVVNSLIINLNGALDISPYSVETISSIEENSDLAEKAKTILDNTELLEKELAEVNVSAAENVMNKELNITRKRKLHEVLKPRYVFHLYVYDDVARKRVKDLFEDCIKVYQSLLISPRVINGGFFTTYHAINAIRAKTPNYITYKYRDSMKSMFSLDENKQTEIISSTLAVFDQALSNYLYMLLNKYVPKFNINEDVIFKYLFNLKQKQDQFDGTSKDKKFINPFCYGGKFCINFYNGKRITEENPIGIPIPLRNEKIILKNVTDLLFNILRMSSTTQQYTLNRNAHNRDRKFYIDNLADTPHRIYTSYKQDVRPEAKKKGKEKDRDRKRK